VDASALGAPSSIICCHEQLRRSAPCCAPPPGPRPACSPAGWTQLPAGLPWRRCTPLYCSGWDSRSAPAQPAGGRAEVARKVGCLPRRLPASASAHSQAGVLQLP
jgi:hypothetical protein